MSVKESKIYDHDKLVAVRYVEDTSDGGKRVTTQEAWYDRLGEQRTRIIDERTVYPDGSEYKDGVKVK